ncbi:LuxR C-terminal-related transcriptional regulator [Sinosporangium album]
MDGVIPRVGKSEVCSASRPGLSLDHGENVALRILEPRDQRTAAAENALFVGGVTPSTPPPPLTVTGTDPRRCGWAFYGKYDDVGHEAANGMSNRDVARELSISVTTASVHVSNILRKLGVKSRGEAAALARRDGLLNGVATGEIPPVHPSRV